LPREEWHLDQRGEHARNSESDQTKNSGSCNAETEAPERIVRDLVAIPTT